MVPHELSLVLEKEIVRARFMADPALVTAVCQRRLEDAHDQMINAKEVSLSDFRVRRLDQENVGAATQWVRDVSFEAGLDVAKPAPEEKEEAWQRWQTLLQAAHQVKNSLDAPGAIPTFLFVEFVWKNGGGDDNVFTQGFWVNDADQAPLNDFQEALEAIESKDGPFYDVTWFEADSLAIASTLEELRDRLTPFKAELPLLMEMLSTLRSLERSHELEQQLPAPQPRPSGPRF